MTDKARKPENTAIKTSRPPVPASLHQLPSPGTGMYSPTASYSLSPDIPHHQPHPHMPYPSMMHPPFPMAHPLSISNDLGPPIFMPSLNLGTPKSSSSYPTRPSKAGSYQNADSPTQGNYSNLIPSGSPFQSPSVIHPSQLTYTSIPNKQQASGQVKKLKLDSGTGTGITRTSSPTTPQPSSANNLLVPTDSMGTSLPQSPTINLVKPTLTKPTAIITTSVAGNNVVKQYPMGVASKGDTGKSDGMGFEPSSLLRTDSGGVVVTTLASGISGGNTLFCTEGLPPPLPRHMTTSCPPTSSLSTDTKSDRLHQTPNHYPSSNADIPRPEAVSRNIIIPAQSLTGKDIANLTSSSSSPLNPNDHTPNDLHHVPSDFNEGSSGESVTTVTRMSPIQSPPHVMHYDVSQQVMGVVSTGVQGSSSPRPSILKKRPFDRLSEVATGIPKLASSSMLKPASTDYNSESHSNREHLDITSPRKRPRKQHFDSIMDTTHSSQLKSDSSNHTLNKITSPTHLSATHDRLTSPLPSKKRHNSEEERLETDRLNASMIYLTQLKQPQYRITHNAKTIKGLHNHFRRPADVKHKVDQKTPVHELCNQGSTWLRSSGWKLESLDRHLEQIKQEEKDILELMEGLEVAYRGIHSNMAALSKSKQFEQLDEIMQGNIVRSRRTLLHLQETQETVDKVMEVNPKVVDIMKKYATNLPVSLSITSTIITRSKS